MSSTDDHRGGAELERHADGELARMYHQNTSLTAANLLEFEERLSQATAAMEELYPQISISPAAPQIALPRQRGWWGLDRLIRCRRTIRRFTGRPLGMTVLSRLLLNTAGVTSRPNADADGIPWPRRAAPSAGALFPLEYRLAALNVGGLGRGIYRYQTMDHCLERLAEGVPVEHLGRVSLHGDLVAGCGAVIGFVADWRRLIVKYGDRGYRFALLEAGHAAQNLLLTSTALGLAAVPVGGFIDEEVAGVFGCNTREQHLVYLIVVGR
ncbi:MAG: SagB/ThcOx family dehydrogenase [Phycisphaerae bacterium]|nr:SagB/ThcOx family dehydrogenase [Phycisphaerae bacterium]